MSKNIKHLKIVGLDVIMKVYNRKAFINLKLFPPVSGRDSTSSESVSSPYSKIRKKLATVVTFHKLKLLSACRNFYFYQEKNL